MKKLKIVLVLCLLISGAVKAQMGNLLVKKSDKGLYIEHKVIAKEGLFSIGRLYHVHPRFLASFNNLDYQKGLNLGLVLRVPLTDTNFNQRSAEGMPLFHEVAAGDGLSAISRSYNAVSLANLREWNQLSSDNLNKGQKLKVGFLSMTNPLPVAPAPVAAAKIEEKPAQKEEVKEEVKEVVKEAVAVVPAPEKPVVKKEEPIPAPPTPKNVQVNTGSTEGGFFQPHFGEQSKQKSALSAKTVSAGVFKTTSGWQDAKYYVLIDDIVTGSVVKITNPSNNKVIFAKVLGQIGGIRQNQGLDARISNAAAAALGITEEEKFVLQVHY